MALFVNVLLASVVTCSLWVDVAAQGAEVKSVDNAEQFALLCRIYNVAKNPPINHVDLQDPNRIVDEIDAINASFSEKKQFNETEQVGNSSDAQVKRTTSREETVSQALLSRIKKKAHTILKEIRKLNETRNIEKVKSEFAEVIYGEEMNESDLCNGALKGVGDRGAACGRPGEMMKGTHSGKNMVVDFFCLCAMRTEAGGKDKEGVQDICGVYLGSKNGNHGWNTKCPETSSTMWASVKKGCGSLTHQSAKPRAEGHEVIEDFLKHLKSGGLYRWADVKSRGNNVVGSGRKEGMMGTGAGTEGGKEDILCNGSRGYGRSINPPGGVCVYYGPESEWDNIDWLKKFRTALSSTHTLNNQTSTIQRDIEKLQTLLHRAEEIYETAKVITEVQHPVVPTNLQTAAKRLTAYNAAWIHPTNTHFILLFVLL
ncbi:Variant surface glycoprotein [Trypanosoma congolense IL3000]|uniref:Variant surface glycoprotein n=1 Tax=Trypanosoma congolense (strain IL3000) TaxID=1068625 RepID=F9WAT0_TRYCI|nr:Variant surface glycoprotein [Trypanosoma congolense IL3000]